LRDLAHLLFDQRRYEEAADAVDRLTELGPQDLDLFSRIADGHIDDGQPERAEATLIELADHYRRAIERNRSELARHLAEGDENEALWAVPPDVDLRAALAGVLATIGDVRWKQGRREAAQAAFSQSIALLGEPSPARVAFEAHFALPKPVRYWINDRWRARLRDLGEILRWIHAEMGDEAAAGFLRQALDVISGTDYRERWGNFAETEIARDLGLCLLQLGRNEEAAEAFRLGLDLEPEFAHLHVDLGLALYRLERFSEAETEWRRAIDLDPKDPRAYRSLGWLIAKRGRLDEGLRLFRQAIELAPDDTWMRYYPGWLLLRAGHVGEALAQYALAAESQLRDAGQRALDELLGNVGQAGGAPLAVAACHVGDGGSSVGSPGSEVGVRQRLRRRAL
ncbi:MAG: tetratricopeptide repeat protein, partial [Candidatus Rokuibacteriota bacterium]